MRFEMRLGPDRPPDLAAGHRNEFEASGERYPDECGLDAARCNPPPVQQFSLDERVIERSDLHIRRLF
ncbi:hypothetical protein ACFPYI_12345 [Halomarina salina]|uniref:Uncharacterized protein n=1 Tax=Halomarina salina TaxID=1872699 RepID=A0ABD5RNW4_9EURY|nr:hypothetical protein [Halomarina salina]